VTHELATMRDLVRAVERVAEANGATRVVRIRVRLGALSHFTPGHFLEHWQDASRGSLGEGAEVEARLSHDYADPNAQGVVLEEVEVAYD
jgi:hydrogenase nickel incorporation protein HypA/HybF